MQDLEKEQSKQIQQMLNLEEDMTALKGSCGRHL